jgi:proton-dependent oligopeptide transporter, POT family
MSNAKPASAYSTIHDHRQFLGHPVGLYYLFFTEMWERFSYYGMRALLILYMTQHLLSSARGGAYVFGFGAIESLMASVFGPLEIQPLSSQIYGIYTALVYLTPLFGGLLADKILGQRKTVFLGGTLMAIGHFLMAIESMFFLALFFLIIGNGCFKPNISTQVGSLYPAGDPRRDRAFTIFYMGVNLGAFFSPLVCGTLGKYYGWHYGFAAAGVGMIAGLIVYACGQKYLAEDQLSRDKDAHVEHPKLTKAEWGSIGALIVLAALNVAFWAIYEQQGNTIQLFADSNTDWHVFGWEMPSTWFQSFNALFIFMFAPLLNIFWGWQAKRGKEPGSIIKMSIGVFVLGLSFLILMYTSKGLGATEKISFLWLVGVTLIYTIGELYLSPIGLSLVSKVAPVRLVGMMMGMWFLSVFLGNYLSGYIGMYYSTMSKDSFFLMLTVIGVVDALAILAFAKPLKKAFGRDV